MIITTNTQKEYFDNGKPKFEVTYKDGKKNGEGNFLV
jgi:antitoxin component YwqK of YwqJK toxin-antitoxin module